MTRPDFTRSAFLRGGAAVASGTIASSIMAAILTTILGVELGEDGYGTYAFVIASAGLLSAIGRVGVGPIVVRNIAKSVSDDDTLGRREPILSAVAVAVVATTILTLFTISPIGTRLFDAAAHLDTAMVGALTVLFASQALFLVNAESLRGLHYQGWATFLALPTQRIVSLLLVGWVVWVVGDDLSLTTALWLTAIAGATAAIFSGTMLWYRARPLPTSRIGSADLVETARDGTPVMITNILGVIATRLPIWVLAVVGAVSDAGVFALAAAFIALIRLAHRTMLSTVSPFIASSYYGGQIESLQRRLRLVAAGTSMVAFSAGIAMVVGGILLVPRVFGDNFGESVPVSAVLVAGTLFSTYAGPCGMVLNVTGNERWMARANVISLVVGAALMLPAASLWGATGAAVAQAAMMILRVSLQLRYTSAHTGIDTRADYGALYRSARRAVAARRDTGT